jgi:hypothetical protein
MHPGALRVGPEPGACLHPGPWTLDPAPGRVSTSSHPGSASNSNMGRSALGARGCAAVALMACCLAVTASAQQASVAPAPAGSTLAVEGNQPVLSVERIKEKLGREPVLRLDSLPVFSLTVNERRPRYWDLQSPFLFTPEPRTSTTRWHDEFLSMVTPDEARLYSPMLTPSETATIAATSLLFAGAASLVKAGFLEWRESRREGNARKAEAEVDAALAAWALANERK